MVANLPDTYQFDEWDGVLTSNPGPDTEITRVTCMNWTDDEYTIVHFRKPEGPDDADQTKQSVRRSGRFTVCSTSTGSIDLNTISPDGASFKMENF